MQPAPDATTLATALAALPAFGAVRPDDLQPLSDKGLAHAHWRVRDRGLMLRVPRPRKNGRPAADQLAYQAAAFERAAPSGRTPRLHGIVPPSPNLPQGALIVDDVAGRPPRLPAELSLLAETLAALHVLPLPAPKDRAPLDDTPDAFVATLRTIEGNLRFLNEASITPAARRQIDEEIAWARAFADERRPEPQPAPHTLIVTDAHPGNFLVTPSGFAMFVDLEKAAYSSPAIDIAHATLRPATRWDPDCGVILARDEIERFVRLYFKAVGPELEQLIRPWLLPMRRLIWLRTTTVFARFRVERAAALLAPPAATHAEAMIADALDPETIETVRREWLGPDGLSF